MSDNDRRARVVTGRYSVDVLRAGDQAGPASDHVSDPDFFSAQTAPVLPAVSTPDMSSADSPDGGSVGADVPDGLNTLPRDPLGDVGSGLEGGADRNVDSSTQRRSLLSHPARVRLALSPSSTLLPQIGDVADLFQWKELLLRRIEELRRIGEEQSSEASLRALANEEGMLNQALLWFGVAGETEGEG